MTAATAVALGGCLFVAVAIIHVASTDPADSGLALTYGGVGLCGELIAMLGLVSSIQQST